MYSARDSDDMDRFFRGLTEHAFFARLGVVDPPLIDDVALMLVRFVRNAPGCLPPGVGPNEIDDVVRMLAIVQQVPLENARDGYREIGDYTLFWSGLYPEALQRVQYPFRQDHLLDYRAAGKKAYWIASTIGSEDTAEERQLLKHLSHEYDLCVEGLAEVRRAWKESA